MELGAFIDKHHFPAFLNNEEICYIMKIGAKTYELSEFIKLFQLLKKKQKILKDKHVNEDKIKELKIRSEKFNKIKELNKNKIFHIGNDYPEYFEEIQRKYENVMNCFLTENQEEQNIDQICHDLKQHILKLQYEDFESVKNTKRFELFYIPGSLSEYFAKDQKFRQYFDDVYYLNEEINKRQESIANERQRYLKKFKNTFNKNTMFSHQGVNIKQIKKKNVENEILLAALFGNGISI